MPRPALPRSRRRSPLLAALLSAVTAMSLTTAAPAQAAGYQLTFRDDFSGTRVDTTKWGVYNGGNGGNRTAAHAIVKDGKLILRNKKVNGTWMGAGVSASRANKQTYGKYEMRVRFDRGYGVRAVGLLWPADGGWPPEVDFYEIPASNANRTLNTLTNHYGTRTYHKMHHASYTGKFDEWHTVGVEWTPTEIRYLMDGQVRAVMRNNIPKEPMWLGIQTRPGSSSGTKPNSTTPSVVDLEVDWVKIYKRVA